MNNENVEHLTPGQDEDMMLPEGYKEGDNFFEESDEPEGFGGETEQEEGSAETASGEDADPDTAREEDAAASAVKSSDDTQKENVQPPAVQSIKFKHGDVDVELTEIDLPGVYSKAKERDEFDSKFRQMQQSMDQMQQYVDQVNAKAKGLGFADARAMMERAEENYRTAEMRALVDKGASEEEAKEIIEHRMEAKRRAQAASQSQQFTPVRDFRREMSELLADRPNLREHLANGGKIPQEVFATSSKNNVSLRTAYAEYELKEARAENERIKKENEILKQNEANAKKAPVKSVTAGGGVKAKSKDPFLMGFESDN